MWVRAYWGLGGGRWGTLAINHDPCSTILSARGQTRLITMLANAAGGWPMPLCHHNHYVHMPIVTTRQYIHSMTAIRWLQECTGTVANKKPMND